MPVKHTSFTSASPVNPTAVASIPGPSITREAAAERIRQDPDAFLSFSGFPKEEQEKILDLKELIGMYSEALAIMDRNTVLYMCDEQKKEIGFRKKFIV